MERVEPAAAFATLVHALHILTHPAKPVNRESAAVYPVEPTVRPKGVDGTRRNGYTRTRTNKGE
ncbi:MAG: hypothetical protein AAGU23_10525 [Bacillota bacterium]